MDDANHQIEIEKELNKLKAEIYVKQSFVIKTFEKILELLTLFRQEDQTQFIYLNRYPIQVILLNEDQIIKINQENINYNGIKSLFYFGLAINNDKYVVNYSYSRDFINDLLEKIKNERNELIKLLLFILFNIIFENFKQLNSSTESNESEENDKITKEYKTFINEHLSLLNQFDIHLNSIDKDNVDIEDIYSNIIISLLRKRKFDDNNYIIPIMEQLDMKNIELTNKMFEALKKEFDENSTKDYLDNYKIKTVENLDNEKIVNFFSILFQYVFKDNIYLYNINFLSDSRKCVINIVNSDFSIITKLLKPNLNSIEEKKYSVLIHFLDSDYYILKGDFYALNEILKYYQNFNPNESKIIEQIEELRKNKDINIPKEILNEYDEAQKKNKRLKLYKFIYESNSTKKDEKEFKKICAIVDKTVQAIQDKKTNLSKIKFRNELFKFFSDEKNKNYILEIFNQDEIDIFMKCYNLYYIIRVYFQNFFFVSKKEDIKKIEITIENKENYNLEEYLQYLDIAKEKNQLYSFISKIFTINNQTKTEKEVELKIKKWEDIKKKLESKNFDFEDDDIKIKLFMFCNNKKKVESHKEILEEDWYKFVLEKKAEAEEIILHYYKTFYPESKKKVIESGKFEDKDYEQYSDAKKMKIREPIIFSLMNGEKNLKEKKLLEIKKKWENMEIDINNKIFSNIDENDKQNIIKFFEKKDDDKNKFIKQIFDNESIDAFIRANKNKNQKKSRKNKYDINSGRTSGTNDETKYGESTKSNSSLKLSKNVLKIENERQSLDIFQKKTEILLSLKNKSLEIHDIKAGPFHYSSNYLKENMDKIESDSDRKKMFEILEKLKNKLTKEYKKDFKLIIELSIERRETKYLMKYKLIKPNSILKNDDSIFNNEKELWIDLSTYNFDSENTDLINQYFGELETLLDKINSLEYSKAPKTPKEEKKPEPQINETRIQNNQQNEQNNSNNLNNTGEPDTKNISMPTGMENNGIKDKYNKYKVLALIKYIGFHNEPRKLTTAEFVKELKKSSRYFISVGNDKKIKVYNEDNDLNEEKLLENSDIKEWIYDIIEVKINNEKSNNSNTSNFYDKTFVYTNLLACTNKEICSLKLTEKGIVVDNRWELPNIACASILNMEFEETIKVQNKNNKNKRNKNKNQNSNQNIYKRNYSYLIAAGRNGVMALVDIFGDKSKGYEHFDIIKEGAFRGLCKISETCFAVTSNSIISEGMNRLIIFNFDKNSNAENNKKKVDKIYDTYKKENNKDENHSFIASNFGMATLSEDILLCSCKKYSSKDKNGILMVIISEINNSKSPERFFETGEFEVHCICPIIKKKGGNICININSSYKNNEEQYFKTCYFFAGGFDNKFGEGKIKLFKLDKKNNEIRGIKFLQDVEIYEEEKEEHNSDNKKEENYKIFDGAISSLIQSTNTEKIIASCYDGRVYLLSTPNLKLYEKN